MTIAAGFVHREGVLLCADTQQETGTMKIEAPKVGSFDCPGGQIAYALAGNVPYAESAISKCRRKLKGKSPQETFDTLEDTLDKEYRRVVFKHPQYPAAEWTLAYSLLLALWSPNHGVRLYVTSESTTRPVNTGYECIGTGQDLGHYLIGTSFVPNMREQDALILAAYTLNRVKTHVPGCGGRSQFVAMHNNGTVSPVASAALDEIEESAKEYESHARTLLFLAASKETTDQQLENQIGAFKDRLLNLTVSSDAEKLRASFSTLLSHLGFQQPNDVLN